MKEIDQLKQVVDRLRGKKGCPWDKKQTHKTLKPYMIEEAYEALDAIDREDPDKL
ncbi:MAG: MazG nucleotide pyrophosphohydrolase domain-containing protein, partial [Candidatus Margulisiibacteriota bacterium]